jgi:hypothetical protein
MKVPRRAIVPLALLLGLLLVVAVAANVNTEETEDDSRTNWAKDKISEGLGFKHQQDEEEVGKKAGEAIKSTRENAQEIVDGELCVLVLLSSFFPFTFVCN